MQPDGEWLPLRRLASYSSMSVRTLRSHVASKRNPLPSYRVGGKVLVRRSEFDTWMRAFRRGATEERDHVSQLVDELIGSLTTAPSATDNPGHCLGAR
jgi:excisionase family DNA binding protein